VLHPAAPAGLHGITAPRAARYAVIPDQASATAPWWLKRPAVFAAAVVAAHLLVLLPALIRHHFDFSVFIVAGDRYVTLLKTVGPIAVLPHSNGYDGQFFYRLALAPFDTDAQAFGVTFDHPAFRAQRILYPLLARLLALGQARAVPAALFAVNLAALFTLAWVAARMAAHWRLPALMVLAIVAWPGWLVALTHDTAELVASALLLAATAAFLSRRRALFALLFALCCLTRETAVLAACGLAALQLVEAARRRTRYTDIAWTAAAVAPFLLWRLVVTAKWPAEPQAYGVTRNVGWPLLGWAQTLLANILNRAVGGARHPRDFSFRLTTLAWACGLAWFWAHGVTVALRSLPRNGLAAGWLAIAALMITIKANASWVEPVAFFRGFSEFWVLGCLVIATNGQREGRIRSFSEEKEPKRLL
jgi:hypothetical protein